MSGHASIGSGLLSRTNGEWESLDDCLVSCDLNLSIPSEIEIYLLSSLSILSRGLKIM
jgi:hypothetical protein